MEETNKLYYGPMPRVLNEDILSFLCIKHKGEIGIGAYFGNRCPRIRYVIDKDRFGYADFGDFFFWEDGGLYVWQQSEEFEEDHNPDIVEDFFGHSCEEPVSIWDKALTFNNTYRDKEDESVLRTMARYTPNFDKEVWKYLGLEILGLEEFDWKKTNKH